MRAPHNRRKVDRKIVKYPEMTVPIMKRIHRLKLKYWHKCELRLERLGRLTSSAAESVINWHTQTGDCDSVINESVKFFLDEYLHCAEGIVLLKQLLRTVNTFEEYMIWCDKARRIWKSVQDQKAVLVRTLKFWKY